ncbi:hypothetical protein B1813_04805 [Saccharomonospora piscinae]|uniref:DUF4389 domain-containing protein n=1 Tax=Saccharomonospora piscinae TaxID=687388 RepID=A0A1V9AA92_SACPI|nr:DUF4389 domain-containing protein [Saccharomonospora piscinae]OQO93844.1 hypothetical protein B1813_04805 [Saccharomonospora piscinae]TLW95010.1 DUF4389 domain-containing protein [Saccharomonospora piscinae]
MTTTEPAPAHPVRVRASLDPELSRWLWLVKWLLALPHFLVLAVLWLAVAGVTFVAFVAVLVTGRYPRALFDFTVGVLRWSWRVHYYAYAALGTDRYPPFTLADVPDYPARLEVDYPPRLSRGLALVKWLLAVPHYLVVGLFTGGAWGWWWSGDDRVTGWGLIGILVLVAAIVLLFTGRYPRSVFEFVVGLDRWVVRVVAYVGLLTDVYPPFRLEQGGDEPGPARAPGPGGTAPPGDRRGWTAGRVSAVVGGFLLTLAALALLAGGGTALWADTTQRDTDGYVTASTTLRTGSGALATERIDLGEPGDPVGAALGDLRVRVTPTEPGREVFLGVAPAADVARYLRGTSHAVVRDLAPGGVTTTAVPGPPPAPPGTVAGWTAQASGAGTQEVRVPSEASEGGDWAVVVVPTGDANGSRGVSVRAEVGATAPALPWVAVAGLAVGTVVLAGGSVLIALAARRASPPGSAASSAA